MSTNTGLYCRQSRNKERSIARQESECLADLKEIGWNNITKYQDGVSASRFGKKPREGWQELLRQVEAGKVDAVCMWEVSRGDRKLSTWVGFLDMCRDKKILIRVTDNHRTYDMNNPDDYDFLARAGASSAHESEKTRKRILSDVRANAQKGRPQGKNVYGYLRRYDGNRQLLEVVAHPEQAFYVTEAIRRVAEGEALYSIARDYQAINAPAPRGTVWHENTIRRFCLNREYLGVRVHLGSIVAEKAMWPALIDEPTFYRAKTIIENPTRRSWEDGSVKHLLTGIAECSVCDTKLRLVQNKGKHYYRCPKFHVNIRKTDLDEHVDSYMRTVTTSLVATDLGQPLKADVDLGAIKAKIAGLRQQLEVFLDEAVGTGLSASTVAGYETRVNAQIKKLEQDLKSPYVPQIVYDLIEDPSVWINAGILGQRTLVAELLRVRVKPSPRRPGRFGRQVAADERVELVAVGSMGALVPSRQTG